MKNLRVYRPSKNGGCAAEFQIKKSDGKYPSCCVMLQIVPQDGFDKNENAKFIWSRNDAGFDGVTMKLGMVDIGELLAVLNGVKSAAGTGKGLYHENAKGNSILKFDGSEKGVSLSISSKSEGADAKRFNLILSHSDCEILKIILGRAVQIEYLTEVIRTENNEPVASDTTF